MAMPANVTTVVVLGTFLTPEGEPSTGTVSFTPSSWLTNSGANVAIPNSTVSKTLGTAGNFSVTLPVTDDADLSPSGFIYTVSEVIDGVSQNYNIAIPGTIASGGTLYLADLAPVAPAGPEYYSLASSLSIGTVSTLPSGSAATALITGLAPNQTLNLGIPTGPTGAAGSAATIAVGTTSSVPNSGTATVTNVGTTTNGTLNFVLRDGPTGPQGPQGLAATITVGTVTSGTAGGTPSVTNSGTSGSAVLDFVLIPGNTGPTGSTGPQGSAATVTLGTVGFVDYPGPGTVTNSGTSGSAVLNFVLVRGPQGAIGDLTASAPLSYVGSQFSLNVGAGLETAGTTLAVTYGTVTSALGTAAAGTANRSSRQDHVHTMPTAANVGAVGTATTITAGTALAGGGDLSANRTLNVVLSTTTPAALGTAAVGTATSSVARSDHVHAMPTAADVGAVANSLFTAARQLLSSTASGTPAVIAIEDDQIILSNQVFN